MLELAERNDAAAVEALAQQVHLLHVQWRPDVYALVPRLYEQERFAQAVRDRQLYVARLEGRVVGYALLPVRCFVKPGLVPRMVMTVEEFCVDEKCRGQGIGRQMMAQIKALAREMGCTDIQLTCDPHNEAAIHLYEAAGMNVKCIQYQLKI